MSCRTYTSTRSDMKVTPAKAVLDGIASDGGLYVPENFRNLGEGFDWKSVMGLDYQSMATAILDHLMPGYDMADLVRAAYTGKFASEEVTPLRKVGKTYVLELFEGPTSAFKDVALSMLPQLVTASQKTISKADSSETVILTATSGDTGKAALEGFHDVEGTRIIVFFPHGGVSAVQRAQMVTQQGSNVHVCAVRGNFDDCQTAVKKAFAEINSKGLLEGTGKSLSSANSINIGRLAPQVVYYFKAYSDLVSDGQIKPGDKVDYVVPTGNFGDILAGYYALLLGLPVGRLVCASNQNNVLTDFFRSGIYDRNRDFFRTTSPSMDILVSSNLERLLYMACDGDASHVRELMSRLSSDGVYRMDDDVMKKINSVFCAWYCTEEETSQEIARQWKEFGYLCDPHTAVAFNGAAKYTASSLYTGNKVVVLSTASAYKFPQAVLGAIGQEPQGSEFQMLKQLEKATGTKAPENLASLEGKKELHSDVIDRDEILSYVLEKIKEN